MTPPGTSLYTSNQSAIDDAEFQFQQELRAMFTVDTQQHLQLYFTLVQQLTAQSWAADIQHIYRAVHTVKGGAITVEADAMLHAGTVLEDLLSDLRHLDQAPALEDGQLIRVLLEAGELLSSSIEISATGEQAIAQVQPTVQRLHLLHEQVKQRYMPDWSELQQVHKEFAEQGFELVVLELEMALGNIPAEGIVPEFAVETAHQTLQQLIQIGHDLQFAESWTVLIQQCEVLITQPDVILWRSVWSEMFEGLKVCAKQGGELSIERQRKLQALCTSMLFNPVAYSSENGLIAEATPVLVLPTQLALSATSERFIEEDIFNIDHLLDSDDCYEQDELDDLTDSLDDLALETLKLPANAVALDPYATLLEDEFKFSDFQDMLQDLPPSSEDVALTLNLPNLQSLSDKTALEALSYPSGIENLKRLGELSDLDNLTDFSILDSFGDLNDGTEEWDDPELTALRSEIEGVKFAPSDSTLSSDIIDAPVVGPISAAMDIGLFPTTEVVTPAVEMESMPVASESTSDPKRGVQIPVPLERLDQSAQQVVETLLDARSVMNSSQKLQSQMTQLNSLTQESAQFVTRLRQLQDDYALLRNLTDEQDTTNPLALERYRQGYSTINRLLENILRMSELGQEIETINQQAGSRLDRLDRSILRLKDGIETSRLIPFRNLTLRSRAILRDLTNRYGKPAELVVTGEQVELDAGIVQQLEPLLLHLLRNAYDHGLEPIEERLANGKSMQGTIALSLQRRGNLYRLTLGDDGRGMDRDIIQQQAQAKGFPLTQTRTPAELLAVLCQPGFSSRSVVSEVSGRGVGMDVVAGQIEAMGGKLTIQTQVGQGTRFMLEIPAPQLLVPCVLIQVGDRTVAVPTEEILETVLISSIQVQPSATKESLCTWTMTTSRGKAQGFDLSHYWSNTGRSLPENAICIRTKQADEQADGSTTTSDLWFIADDLLGQEDLLINPLPSPLITPAGLLGVSLQPDGCLISILDPVALAEVIRSAPIVTEMSSPELSTAEPESSAITILVVDDAALMRRRLEGSLHSHGFATYTCADGVEALNWLQTNGLPDLMITDVEMPNMDGFTLIDRCRQSGMEMPILVVSSRLSEEWGGEAKRLGATDYLNKGFSTAVLIDKVNQCLGFAVAMVKE
jgi:chemotaxis protein histidine kinase CheA